MPKRNDEFVRFSCAGVYAVWKCAATEAILSSVQASFDLPLITMELTVAPSTRSANTARHREDGGIAGGKALFNRLIETVFETRVVRADGSAQRFRPRSSRAWRACPAHATTSTTFTSLVSPSRIEHRHRLRRCREMNWAGLP
jgi:hypothetical protein